MRGVAEMPQVCLSFAASDRWYLSDVKARADAHLQPLGPTQLDRLDRHRRPHVERRSVARGRQDGEDGCQPRRRVSLAASLALVLGLSLGLWLLILVVLA